MSSPSAQPQGRQQQVWVPGEDQRPLQGDTVFDVKVSTSDQFGGQRTLASRWSALELGLQSRIDTIQHPRLPGVHAVFLHAAEFDPESRGPVVLEEARIRHPDPQTFLLSRTGSSALLVSSVIGYRKTGPVQVLEAYTNPPYLGIDLVDYSVGEGGRVFDDHIRRLKNAGGNPREELPAGWAHGAFRHMMQRTDEVG